MIGQDIIPGFMPMPERELTTQEQKRWLEAMSHLQQLRDKTIATQLKMMNFLLADRFGQKRGIDLNTVLNIPTMADHPLTQAQRLTDNYKRVLDAVRAVQDLTLALNYRIDGDIDIVDPRVQQQPKGDMGAVVIIAAGVVVVGGIIAALYHYKKEADALRPKYNNLLAATDKVFCDPNSPQTCKDWEKFKAEKGMQKRQSLSEQIFDSVKVPVKTGLQWGTAAVIAGLALTVAMAVGKRAK
jgi:hypothetical protein